MGTSKPASCRVMEIGHLQSMYLALFAIVFAVLTLLGMGDLGTPMVASAAGLLALPIWAVVRGIAYVMGKSFHAQREVQSRHQK